jgi:hypothetical protein
MKLRKPTVNLDQLMQAGHDHRECHCDYCQIPDFLLFSLCCLSRARAPFTIIPSLRGSKTTGK